MFKIYISESAYKGITSSATTGLSYLGKLLNKQPLQLLKETETKRYKEHPENVLKNPSALYILDISEGKDIYYKFHNRRIVSNYFVVKMDYTLAAFNKTEGTSEQTIIPQVLFTEDSLNKNSSAPLLSMQQITKALKSFSESLKSPSMDHNSYSYAINGQQKDRCLTITNRLIK